MRRLLTLLIMLVAATALAADSYPCRFPAAERVVAMGDWHGDLEAARRGLRLAGAIDEQDRWIGGDLVVVQTGDQLDRGDDERAILDLLARLEQEAAVAGGAVHVLLGNHELMNVDGDFRYVTPGGWDDFADIPVPAHAPDLRDLPPEQRPRAAAFRPGGPYALQMSRRNVAVIVGRTLFVHGGLLPRHLEAGTLESLNADVRRWLRGDGPEPAVFKRRGSPVWARNYSDEPDQGDCELLAETLARLDCDRMVVGHTVQDHGITPNCSDQVWCIDTGASAHYGGSVQVLEITDQGVRALW